MEIWEWSGNFPYLNLIENAWNFIKNINNNIYIFIYLFKFQYPMYLSIRAQWTVHNMAV